MWAGGHLNVDQAAAAAEWLILLNPCVCSVSLEVVGLVFFYFK